jgi:hypothetical protein
VQHHESVTGFDEDGATVRRRAAMLKHTANDRQYDTIICHTHGTAIFDVGLTPDERAVIENARQSDDCPIVAGH